jgi:hypothetical protein
VHLDYIQNTIETQKQTISFLNVKFDVLYGELALLLSSIKNVADTKHVIDIFTQEKRLLQETLLQV